MAERVSSVSDRPIAVERPRLDPPTVEPVHDQARRIDDKGLRFDLRPIRSHPHLANPTAHILTSQDLIVNVG
jgi:hypothetical protein